MGSTLPFSECREIGIHTLVFSMSAAVKGCDPWNVSLWQCLRVAGTRQRPSKVCTWMNMMIDDDSLYLLRFALCVPCYLRRCFSRNHTDLYSADVYTCIHIIMVVIQNHIMFASFWLIVNVCSFTSLVRTPIPPLLRRWGWCSWDAHGVGVQRRHLEAMRHLETISLFWGRHGNTTCFL